MNASLHNRDDQKSLLSGVGILVGAALIFTLTPTESYSQSTSLTGTTVRICGGVHEWPPFYYQKRVNSKKTDQIVGFDISLFEEIFTKKGINYTVKLLPWKRCLGHGMQGKGIDAVIGGGLNDQRRADYVTTTGYYSVVPSYFYKNSKFPGGVNANAAGDLKSKGRLCGVKGFNYVNFGQNNDEIDMGAKNYSNLVKKTLSGNCDIGFARLEVLNGWGSLLNIDWFANKDLSIQPVPQNPPESFHVLISKNYKHAKELKRYFEAEVARLQSSGKLKEIMDQHTGGK